MYFYLFSFIIISFVIFIIFIYSFICFYRTESFIFIFPPDVYLREGEMERNNEETRGGKKGGRDRRMKEVRKEMREERRERRGWERIEE